MTIHAKSDLLPLYLRKVMMDNGRFSVEAFRPTGDRVAYWPWHVRNRPDKRNKTFMFNCYRWCIVWLPTVGAHDDYTVPNMQGVTT